MPGRTLGVQSSPKHSRHRFVRKRKRIVPVSLLTFGLTWEKRDQIFDQPFGKFSQQLGKRMEFSHVCRNHLSP
ncbi:hypothetical protein TNCV_1931141 [Trichonephila clavipes]|nr:hypothetical protein TNCV_1931141 [Trichonephila clavipes]